MLLRAARRKAGSGLSVPYGGQVASGPPVSGAHAQGEVSVDLTGQLWVCTVAGTPGTWVSVGSGRELAYAEVTSNLTTAAVGFGNRTDATGLIISPVVGSRPVLVQVFATVLNTTLNDGVGMQIVEAAAGATNVPVLQQSQMISAGIASAAMPFLLFVRLAPSAGTHTYKVMFNATVGGTATIQAQAAQPAFIRCLEC